MGRPIRRQKFLSMWHLGMRLLEVRVLRQLVTGRSHSSATMISNKIWGGSTLLCHLIVDNDILKISFSGPVENDPVIQQMLGKPDQCRSKKVSHRTIMYPDFFSSKLLPHRANFPTIPCSTHASLPLEAQPSPCRREAIIRRLSLGLMIVRSQMRSSAAAVPPLQCPTVVGIRQRNLSQMTLKSAFSLLMEISTIEICAGGEVCSKVPTDILTTDAD